MAMHATRTMLLASLALLLLSGTISAQSTLPACLPGGEAYVTAQWYCDNINQYVAQIWTTWQPIVFIAIFLAFSIAGVIFMTGAALKNERIRNFAIGEIYEAAATTIIAVAFLFIAAVLFGILPAFATGPINPYPFALSYISSTISTTQTAMNNIFQVAMIDQFYGSISTAVTVGGELNIGGQVVQTIFFSIFALFLIPARAIVYLLSDGLLILNLQFYLILFFMYTAIPVFLIPGIVLRSIFPVRNLGGIMIAIAIAFYLIMPVLFSVSYYFTNTGLIQTLNTYAQQIGANGQGTEAQTNAASPAAPLVTAVQGLQNAMGSFWLSILFYPALIAAISYESIKIIAEFIGGATRTSGKLRSI